MSHILRLFQNAEGQTDGASLGEINAEKVEAVFDLNDAPVEHVQIQPELRLVYHTDPRDPAADRYRFLRMRLRQFASKAKLKTLLVTSPLPAEGKSTVALNLATALADRRDQAVLLVDADLHHSLLMAQLGLNAPRGLAECLEGSEDPLSAIRRLKPLDWFLLPAGQTSANPTELLHTPALSAVMQALSRYFDWIVIDSPPVVPTTDPLSLMQTADGVLLVVKAGQTPQTAIEEALQRLGRERLVGIILNGAEESDPLYSKYRGYYK